MRQVFSFFVQQLQTIVGLLRNAYIDDGISIWSFLVVVPLIWLMIHLIKFIQGYFETWNNDFNSKSTEIKNSRKR